MIETESPSTKKVKPVPDNYHTVTPYITVKNGAKALEFYKQAFGAQEKFKMMIPDGRLGHAELMIGNSMMMVCDEFPEHDGKSPATLGGSPVQLYLYVDNVDAWFKKAVAAGATEKEAVKDMFYGDRAGMLQDPFGHKWWVATHVEDVSPEELQKRMATMDKKMEKK